MDDDIPPWAAILGGILLIGAAAAAGAIGKDLVKSGVQDALEGK